MEDSLFATLKNTAASAAATSGAPMAEAWAPILQKMQAGGTLSGAQAAATAQDMADQMQAAVRSSRAAGMRAAQVLAESYTAMVSGVLLGMSEALQGTASAKKDGKK